MENYVFQAELTKSLNKAGSRTAIEYGGRDISYSELDNESSRMMRFLNSKNTTQNSLVGILVDDRIDHISVLIGVLKGGHVVVPLYSGYPDERLKLMVESIQLKHLVIDDTNYDRFRDIFSNEINMYIINEIKRVYRDIPNGAADVKILPDDGAYIHFTSGTTGTPKAVLGRNKSLLHYMRWLVNTFEINEYSRISQFSIPGFDPFLKEILATLLGGGVVCIPEDPNLIQDAKLLVQWVDGNRISLIHCVSSLFRLLSSNPLTNDDFKALKYILLAGEKINPSDLPYWYDVFDERIQLVNCYGPTETTMSKVYYHIHKADVEKDRIPVGKPMNGAQVLILDENMNLCEKLVASEIYIRTPFRSLGYFNDTELTQKRFINNPFNNDDNDIIYKTGDLGRYLLDNNIDILGRTDRQVKIHGYRVELEDIESNMLRYPGVKEAIAFKKELSADTEILVGFISLKNPDIDSKEQLVQGIKAHLLAKLPKYMVPSPIYILDKIPRNHRGKVDYNSLLSMEILQANDYIPPRNETEKIIAGFWSEILGIDKVGINDDFFNIGGNSLNIMSLISRIAGRYGMRIPLGEMFESSTIEEQAQIIDEFLRSQTGKKETQEEEKVPCVPKQAEYDLSYAQKRIWFLSQIEGEVTYNIPINVEVEGRFDVKSANDAIRQIIKRYSILRTIFVEKDGIPKQIILEDMPFELKFHDLTGGREQEEIIKSRIECDLNIPFNLSQGPLIRGILFKKGEESYTFYLNIFHIVFDGWSIGIFVKEFSEFYYSLLNGNTANLPILNNQYIDYVCWQNNNLEKGLLDKQKQYWISQLSKPVSEMKHMGDLPELNNEAKGGIYSFSLDIETIARLKEIARKNDSTIFMALLSGYFLLLHKLSYQNDIIIGVPFAGRNNKCLEPLIGFFVNTLPIRIDFNTIATFADLLKQIRERCINAYQNEYPFDKLVSELNPVRNIDTSPYFSTVCIMHNTPLKINLPGLRLSVKEFMIKNAKFDFKLDMQENDDKVAGRFEYKANKISEETIQSMASQFVEIIKLLIEDADRSIIEIFNTSSVFEESFGIKKLE